MAMQSPQVSRQTLRTARTEQKFCSRYDKHSSWLKSSTQSGGRGGGDGADGGGGGGDGGDGGGGGGDGGPRQTDTSAMVILEPGVIMMTVMKLLRPEGTGNAPGTGAVAPTHDTTKGPAVADAVTVPSALGPCGPQRSAPGPVSPYDVPSHTWNVFRFAWSSGRCVFCTTTYPTFTPGGTITENQGFDWKSVAHPVVSMASPQLKGASAGLPEKELSCDPAVSIGTEQSIWLSGTGGGLGMKVNGG